MTGITFMGMGLRVFVCEFVTGGGMASFPLPPSLCREGDMMLTSLVKDLADLPGLEVHTTRDARLPAAAQPARVEWIGPGEEPWAVWRRQVEAADAVWPIAPESGGVLERLSILATEAGRILLGSRPRAIRLAASKRCTAEALSSGGIAAVATMPLRTALATGLPPSHEGWVVKPDDGAGAEDTFVLRTLGELRRWSRGRADIDRFVVQPFLPGEAASLSVLCRDGRAALLSCNSQDVRLDRGRLRYRGGSVGRREDRREMYAPLAAGIAAAVPDLWGYVGVDLIDTADGPVALEINPRLTTSYAGLRLALGLNPAELVLQLLSCDASSIRLPPRVQATSVGVESDAA